MKKKHIAKAVSLLLILFLCVMYLSEILEMKWRYPCYESIVPGQFYDLEENSVEVCVVGSSQVVYGVSSMELYGEYGISAFSCGTALQPVQASYTWLQEMDKTQDIKLLIYDVSMLFERSDEARYRQAFDNMKISPLKLKQIWNHCQESETADPFISYLFSIIKYHNRWSEIDENDFLITDQEHPVYRGNFAYALSAPVSLKKVAIDNDELEPELEMYDYQLKYFEEMLAYCEQEGIEVLLIKTPKLSWSLSRHLMVEEYAKEHDLTFIEFSNQEMIETLGLDGEKDFRDGDHLNLLGAQKLSKWLGAYINENYELTDFRKVSGYDDMGYARYLQRLEDSNIQLADNVVDYFEHLGNSRYEAVIQVTANPSEFYTEELAVLMKATGLTTDLNTLEGQSYSAWLKAGKAEYEEASYEVPEYTNRFADGIGFRTFSNYDSGAICRMRVNYENQIFSQRGLNILVYDTENHEIIDKCSIYYDTEAETIKLAHDNEQYNTRL